MDDERPTLEAEPTEQLPPATKTPKRLFIALGALGGGIIIAGLIAFLLLRSGPVQRQFTAPLGPTLVPISASGSDRNFDDSRPDDGEVRATDIETVCDGPPQMIILAVGADTTGELNEGGLADTIRIARLDFVDPSVDVLTIPRDTWVEIPGLGDTGERLNNFFGQALTPEGEIIEQEGDWGRINTAYLWGNTYDLPGRGPQVLANTIYLNFGVTVDHYGATNMEVMADAIDAVGGVPITVENSIDGFPAGEYHMSGAEAVRYARVRSTDNDFYRTERQNQVLMALREEYIKPQNYSRLPQIVDRLLDRTQTDLSRQEVLSIACLATRLESSDIRGYALNLNHLNSSFTTGGSYILLQEEDKVQEIINKFLGNTNE